MPAGSVSSEDCRAVSLQKANYFFGEELMLLRAISVTVLFFMLLSCAPKAGLKETQLSGPQDEGLKLPDISIRPQAPAAPPKKTEPARIEKEAEEKYIVLNFDGADIETVIATMSELLKINYILGTGITGKVTIQSYKKFPVRDLFQIFQTVLEINGLTAVFDGNLYRIIPIDTAKQQPMDIKEGKEVRYQLDASFITQIVPLEYIKANDVANLLRSLMPRGTDMVVYEPSNLLIITAQPYALTKFMKLLEVIDIPTTEKEGVKTFVYHIENGEAKKLAEILKATYPDKKSSTARLPAATLPRTTVPAPATPARPQAQAEALPGEIEGEVVITAYEDINALIIKCSQRSYLALLEVLKKIDVPVKQVLIEVLIAEVTLSDKTKFGLEWMLKAPLHIEGSRLTTISGFDQSTSDFPGGISTTISGTVSAGSPFSLITKPDKVGALLTAVAGMGKLNVLASPHILALDNKEAKIEIGDEIPVATGYTTQPATTATTTVTQITTGQIQYRTVGKILTVTPAITDKGRVTLKINLEFSNASESSGIAGNPQFSTRKAQTTAKVQSGHTLILGGLISESKNFSRSGLPFLSKIPVLGYLFGTTSESFDRTELLLMVTPHVISNQDQADVITSDFQDKVKTIKERLDKIKAEGKDKKNNDNKEGGK